MRINSIKNINKVIYLLDKHIIELLNKEDVNDDKLSVLSDIRVLYIEELNSLIRVKNTSTMFNS